MTIKKRYSCCGGSKHCVLNRIEKRVDAILSLKRVLVRSALLDWFLCLEEDRDVKNLTITNLLKERGIHGDAR